MSDYDLYVLGIGEPGNPDNHRMYPGEIESSEDYKRFNTEWNDRHKPKEHEYIDFSRVYCPILDKVRPVILCEQEHGDRESEDWSEFEE